MNDATYEQLCQKAHRWSASCVADVHFTAWIRAIQKARILQLAPEDPWLEDEASIQVRTMRARDLESQVDLPESEHEYEGTLDVIKLPLPIPFPTEEFPIAPQFLFIRPDEYALFKCFGQQRWCILTGNPGVSKSWFQWKFILLCYRRDLFDRFSPSDKEEQVEEPKEDAESFKIRKTKDQTSTEKNQSKQKKTAKPFIPQLIVRTEAGCKSLFFFVDRSSDVLFVKHSPEQLDFITDENSTILWEPASSKTPVYYSEVKAHIIASVSSNDEELFHQFRKNAEMFYMPCPSELQLQLMGQVYRRFAKELEYCPTDAEIHERVKKFGPFIPLALYCSRDQMDQYYEARQREFACICSTEKTLNYVLESSMHIEKTDRGLSGLSHHMARYAVKRDKADCFLGYAWSQYEFSCEEVLNLISIAIGKMGIKAVKQHLIAINEDRDTMEASISVYLERIFELYSLTGLQWKCRQLQSESKRNMNWVNFSVKLNVVERTVTTFQNMNAEVLYYPSDRSFPLVDMYYKDKFGKLVGIKATLSNELAQAVLTYERFYEMIGTNPENTKLELYYLILPSEIEHYRQSSFPDSQFFRDFQSGIGWKNNIGFYCLVPPDNFGLITP